MFQHPVPSASPSSGDGGRLSLAAPTANKRDGHCVMYGQCGRKSFFSPPLNCPVDLIPAVEPAPDFRARLTAKCGARYASGAVCCDPAQLATLESSITIAERFVSACPACWQNMQAFWCDFICHPNQASFLNVTAVEKVAGKDVVMGVDYIVSKSFSRGFFASCKDIKFGPDNRFAMDFIGGGAKSPQQFLDFMGAPKPEVGGSPFPIRFPSGPAVPSTLTPHAPPAIPCNSTIPGTACSCVDCEQVCPVLPPLHNPAGEPDARRPHLPDVPPIPGCTLGTWSCRAIGGAVLVLVIVFGWVVVGLTRWGRRALRRAARKRALLRAASQPQQEQHQEERQGLLSPSSTRAVAGDVAQVRHLFSDTNDDDADDDDDEDQGEDEQSHRHSVCQDPGHDAAAEYSVTVEGGRVHIHVLRTNPPMGAEALFLRLGEFATNRPATTILLSLLVVLLCLSGWFIRGLGIVTDPIGLWVPPNSPALAAKAMFDTHFGPFYRTQQLIVTSTNASSPNIVTESALRQLFALQTRLTLEGTFDGTSLADVCLHPLPNVPVPGGCVVQSVTGYWQNSLAVFNKSDWQAHLATCVKNPAQTLCLPAFGQPIKPEMVMDLDTSSPTATPAPPSKSTSLPTASAFVVTFVNRNADASTPAGRALLVNALKWEAWVRATLDRESTSWTKSGSSLSLAYSTESSIETEVARATSADGWIVAVSYVAMIAYIISTLRSPTVGFTAVVLVLLSVGMAMGIMTWARVPASFILLEVLPFLALAIGVDNVFLLVEALHAVTLFPNAKARVATALSRQGPGFLLSFACEVLVFLAAALIDIPAVSTFALYAATTVACLFFLQCTMFVAVLSLIHVPPVVHSATWWSRFVRWLIRNRWGLLATVAGVTTGAALLLGNVQLGLDQRDALPKDSHLAGYFDAIDKHFAVGPPVYYMVPDVDVAEGADDFVNMCGRFADCRNVSVPNVLEQERKRAWDSYLASPSTAWLDDFVYWLQPNPDDDADDDFGPPSCCARRRSNTTEFCDPNTDSAGDCVSCISPARKWSPTSIRSTLDAVRGQVPDLIRHWLASTPSADCPQAGAAYADTVGRDLSAFAFRSSSVVLSNQTALIRGKAAHELVARELSELTGRQVTAYSVFHPFFAQYDGLEAATWKLLILAHLLVGCVAVVLLSSIRHALLLVVSMAIMLVWIAGVSLGIAGVPLNGVSVVNLVMATGLGVEFCVHVLRAYVTPAASHGAQRLAGPPAKSRTQRVKQALVGAGAAVLAGIGWTKLVGVAVLAFARSSIFRTYYFGLYLCILVAGLMVGLIVLPLLLLFFGAEAKDEESASDDDGYLPYPDALALPPPSRAVAGSSHQHYEPQSLPNGPIVPPLGAASSPDPSRLGRLPARPLHGNINSLLPISGSSPTTPSTATPASPTPTNPRPPAHVAGLPSSTSPSGNPSDSLSAPAHQQFSTPVPLPSHLSVSASEQSSSTGGSTTIQASAAPSTSRPRAIPQYIVAEQQQQQSGGRGKATFEVGSMGQGGAESGLESE